MGRRYGGASGRLGAIIERCDQREHRYSRLFQKEMKKREEVNNRRNRKRITCLMVTGKRRAHVRGGPRPSTLFAQQSSEGTRAGMVSRASPGYTVKADSVVGQPHGEGR